MNPAIRNAIFAFTLILNACKSTTSPSGIIKETLSEELDHMNWVTRQSTEETVNRLNQKQTEPTTALKAQYWYTQVVRVQKLTDSLLNHLKSLKSIIAKQDNIEDFIKAEGTNLFTAFTHYKESLLKVDPLIDEEFKNNFPILSIMAGKTYDKDNFASYFFEGLNKQEVRLMVTHFENDIRLAENKIIKFCAEQVPSAGGWFVYDTPFVAQSSTIIKKGEAIEITAGVAVFSRKAQPIITIDGKSIDLSSEGTAHYTTPVAKSVGKHIVIVNMEYSDPEGKKQSINKNIEYVVR